MIIVVNCNMLIVHTHTNCNLGLTYHIFEYQGPLGQTLQPDPKPRHTLFFRKSPCVDTNLNRGQDASVVFLPVQRHRGEPGHTRDRQKSFLLSHRTVPNEVTRRATILFPEISLCDETTLALLGDDETLRRSVTNLRRTGSRIFNV